MRAVAEAPVGSDVHAVGTAAAAAALRTQGRAMAAEITVDGTLERCSRIRAVVRYRLPPVGLAWAGVTRGVSATGTATELVDPLRRGLGGEATCVR